ncbi:MAG TPA: zinc ribbon domain-containing protein [Blastocatellia bacterium]|nr:zinc ribbon domain-containing protein [Blastocatellia bacterium]
MFCPSCGIEDASQNQFCRGCGTSLNAVRSLLDHPDEITSSAASAREEIGRAIADKIAEFEHSRDLRRVVYEILPAVQDFLTSPEERLASRREQRLNQIRDGVLTSVVGLSIILTFLLISWLTNAPKVLIVSAVGLLVLLIGLGISCTAAWCTDLTKETRSRVKRRRITRDMHSQRLLVKEPTAQHSTFSSVTEGTTRELYGQRD